ncbi:hypothetical protein J2741_002239 [Methanolinea mesophila]|uniref:DUF7847 domain-containing protein n=1 Tax=Methanolinea mesophila TaxID=547055 RepID=UPI001AE57DBE|nr:hypothetical protein [Methanolinea mesophila]MBP1929692.1 hypothetical protein [Methanolinea mesophila]
MIGSAFGRAIRLLAANPLLWIPGLAAGLFVAVDIVLQFTLGLFTAQRLFILELVAMPFFMGGMLQVLGGDARDSATFLKGMRENYFRIILPLVIIVLAILITVILISIPVGLVTQGANIGLLGVAFFGSAIPIGFFTMFFDNVAVFERTKVFESIRRSVEVVLRNPGASLGFLFGSLIAGGIIVFGLMIAWTGILYDQLLPLTQLSPEEVQQITLESINQLLGFEGILITAALAFVGITLVFSILYTFKATLFKAIAETTPGTSEVPAEGEFDSKGRWYKYT